MISEQGLHLLLKLYDSLVESDEYEYGNTLELRKLRENPEMDMLVTDDISLQTVMGGSFKEETLDELLIGKLVYITTVPSGNADKVFRGIRMTEKGLNFLRTIVKVISIRNFEEQKKRLEWEIDSLNNDMGELIWA